MIKQITAFEIDQAIIKTDDVIEFKLKGEEQFKRGIVTFVDKDKIKVVRRYQDQHTFSAHSIGKGQVHIRKLTVY